MRMPTLCNTTLEGLDEHLGQVYGIDYAGSCYTESKLAVRVRGHKRHQHVLQDNVVTHRKTHLVHKVIDQTLNTLFRLSSTILRVSRISNISDLTLSE
jgi:hypothetical protein